MRKIVVAIYIDPDFYPPTINAILNMAERCDELVVVTRNNNLTDYPYPANVTLKKIGPYMTVRSSEKTSTVNKIVSFLRFTFTIVSNCLGRRADLLLLYDPIPLFSFYITRFLIPKKVRVWYHNHDMPSRDNLRKLSIGWFAARYEFNAMKHISYFSLPSSDRLQFYPKKDYSLPYFTIPNYPSLKIYKSLSEKNHSSDAVRIIYQGFIGPGHALEEFVSLLPETIAGRKLHLVLKGSVTEEYKHKLVELATGIGVADQISWVGISPYAELIPLTSSCDIGIGIHMNSDNVSKTLGTASNKIYEYAACGLPVILYDIEQFTKYLGNYSWTYFSDGSVTTLRRALEDIIPRLPELRAEARKDFESFVNFEKGFAPAWNQISSAKG